MIDIINAQKIYREYASNYNIDIPRIRLKYDHILRVMENSKFIARELNLTEEEVNLAMLIGLFHDIGRFEQVRLYDTFSDKDTGLDHAAYSVKVLYEDGLIDKFIDTHEYDNIIKKAVFYHNKKVIGEEVVDEKELLFCKIIRDADKLDIFRVINEEKMEAVFWYKDFSNLEINPKLMEDFKALKLIDYKDIRNNADQIYTFYNYVLDFNFDASLKIIKEKKYLETFTKRIEDTFNDEKITKNTNEILTICNSYIESKINK